MGEKSSQTSEIIVDLGIIVRSLCYIVKMAKLCDVYYNYVMVAESGFHLNKLTRWIQTCHQGN